MKHLIVLLLAAGALSAVFAARPAAIVQTTRLSYTPRQFRTDTDKTYALINVNVRLEYPVDIAGVSQKDTERLRRRLIEKASLLSENAEGKHAPALLNPLLETVIEKKHMRLEDGFCMAALEYEERIAVTQANADYAAIFHEGIYNEGGNGCHSFSASETVRMKTLQPIAFNELVKDREGYARLLIAELRRTCPAEDRRELEGLDRNGTKAVLEQTKEDQPRMLPTVRGMRFVYPPYTFFSGHMGMPEAVIPWEQLRTVCNPQLLTDLEALTHE